MYLPVYKRLLYLIYITILPQVNYIASNTSLNARPEHGIDSTCTEQDSRLMYKISVLTIHAMEVRDLSALLYDGKTTS
jgi:hypothetical protein